MKNFLDTTNKINKIYLNHLDIGFTITDLDWTGKRHSSPTIYPSLENAEKAINDLKQLYNEIMPNIEVEILKEKFAARQNYSN